MHGAQENKVGGSASFTKATSANAATVKVGDIIKIKGDITAGNRHDTDLDLYEHALMIQFDIVQQKLRLQFKPYQPFPFIPVIFRTPSTLLLLYFKSQE